MISVIINWFLIAVVPLAALFIILYLVFRVGLRELKRHQNISMSPLLSHISATVQGLHSIHGYNMADNFTVRWVYNTGRSRLIRANKTEENPSN